MESGSVSTAAARSRATSPRAISPRFSAESRPASSTGCATIGRAGGGGWSAQARSTRFSPRTSPICRGPSASVSSSTSRAVCSQGSNPSRPPPRQRLGQPVRRLVLGDAADLEAVGVHLPLHLQPVAPVDEDDRPVAR